MATNNKTAVDVPAFLDRVEFHDAALLSYVTSSIIVPVYDDIKRDFGIIHTTGIYSAYSQPAIDRH